MPQNASTQRPSLWEVTRSVAAAFFGVQSAAQRQRDFTHGRPLHYLLVGLLMSLALSGLFWMAAQLALSYAR